MLKTFATIKRLAKLYGPYPFPKFLAYVSSNSWSIEYSGAARTNMRSLQHEIFHQWFGRGVTPANGNALWIDEGLARWHDGGREVGEDESIWNDQAVKLTGFSEYLRFTPKASYRRGARFFSVIAGIIQRAGVEGGLEKELGNFFQQHRHKVYTHDQFEDFIVDAFAEKVRLRPLFDRLVHCYGYDCNAP